MVKLCQQDNTKNAREVTIEYDLFNRMVRYEKGTDVYTYTYNGDGQGLSKTVNGVTTEFTWDGMDMILESAGSAASIYVYGNGINYRKTGNSVYTYTTNAHGDVVNYAQGTAVIKEYCYDAFGNELDEYDSRESDNPFRYCGEYYDAETGLYYLRNRYYDPQTGRFITEDTIRDGLNWYTYCGGDPVNKIDPLGLEYVVVSGGNYGETQGYKYNFIEPAIKKIRDLRAENSTERIGWVIANAGWTSDDWKNFQMAVADIDNVHIIIVNDTTDFVNYINYRSTDGLVDDGQGNYTNYRTGDKITKFAVFSHGRDQDTLALGFDYVNYNKHLDFTKSNISQINASAFNNPNSWFYSCYHAIGGDNSFAATWHRRVNGNLTGAYDGQTTYKYITYSRSYFDYWAVDPRKIAEKNAVNNARKKYGFSANGSFRYPEAASGVNQVSWRR